MTLFHFFPVLRMPVLYRPTLLINRESIDTFRCLPMTKAQDGSRLLGKAALRHGRDVLATAERNAAVLSEAFAQLKAAHAAGKRYRLIVPVNSYAVATTAAATLMVKAIKGLPEALRQTVIVELFDFPRTMSPDLLGDITVPLLAFFDKYLAEPNPKDEDYTIFSNLNYFGVSLDLESRGAKGDEAMALMTRFWAEGTKRRLKVVIQGIEEPAIADKARQYEAFAIDGPLLGSDIESLDAAHAIPA